MDDFGILLGYAFLNVLVTFLALMMFSELDGDPEKNRGRILFFSWLLFTVCIEWQLSSHTFPWVSILFGFGYFLAYHALRER